MGLHPRESELLTALKSQQLVINFVEAKKNVLPLIKHIFTLLQYCFVVFVVVLVCLCFFTCLRPDTQP